MGRSSQRSGWVPRKPRGWEFRACDVFALGSPSLKVLGEPSAADRYHPPLDHPHSSAIGFSVSFLGALPAAARITTLPRGMQPSADSRAGAPGSLSRPLRFAQPEASQSAQRASGRLQQESITSKQFRFASGRSGVSDETPPIRSARGLPVRAESLRKAPASLSEAPARLREAQAWAAQRPGVSGRLREPTLKSLREAPGTSGSLREA